jgi:electron transfer flavoprotein beta subunit
VLKRVPLTGGKIVLTDDERAISTRHLGLPRYPSVPGRLRAKRKPVAVSSPSRAEPRLEMVRLVLPPGPGKQVQVLVHGPQAAPAVVEVLAELGVL